MRLILVLACFACRKDEPIAEGEPLSHWKKEAQQVSMLSFWNSQKDERRREAFRVLSTMGEPAVPVLVELLQKEIPVSGDAFNALTNMGPRAAPAVPEMMRLLDSDRPELQLRAAWILGTIGNAAKPALPKLVALEGSATGRLGEVVTAALARITAARQSPLQETARPLLMPVTP